MPYLLLITEQGERRRNRSAKDGTLAYGRMLRYTDDLKARGLLIASDSLKSDAEGVRVEIRGGKRSLIDGPFSE